MIVDQDGIPLFGLTVAGRELVFEFSYMESHEDTIRRRQDRLQAEPDPIDPSEPF